MKFHYYNAQSLYGIPEREQASLRLLSTRGRDPYRLFNADMFKHEVGNRQALYASLPYVTSHNLGHDHTGIIWMNAAETWVDIETERTPKAHFVSESGALDVFMLFGHNPKEVMTALSQVTGFAPLPPVYSLGFHFSKYEVITADSIMKRD